MTWEIVFGVGALVLVVAIAFAVRSNDRRNDRITEAATREYYEHPDTYEKTRRELERMLP